MENGGTRSAGRHDSIIEKCQHVCSFEGANLHTAQWLSWLERRPVTAEVESSNLFWVVCMKQTKFADCFFGEGS